MSLAFNPMSHHDDAYTSLEDAMDAACSQLTDEDRARISKGLEPEDAKAAKEPTNMGSGGNDFKRHQAGYCGRCGAQHFGPCNGASPIPGVPTFITEHCEIDAAGVYVPRDSKAAEDLFGHEPPDWKRGGPTHRAWCNADHRKPIGSDSCSCDTPVADYAASNNGKSHGTGRDIYPLVVADIEARAQVGEKKYGERLKAFNGRNAMTDAYQEALDLAVYLRQHIEETADLRAENEGLKRELDAAVSHHSRYVKTIDRALGEPRFDDCEIMVAHVRAIDALKAEVERLKHFQSIALLAAEYDINDNLIWNIEEGQPVCYVNCNDVFFWGCADAEKVTPENLHVLRQACIDAQNADKTFGKIWATELFVCRVRGMRPQGAAYPERYPALWPLLDACGPPRETTFANPKPRPEAAQ